MCQEENNKRHRRPLVYGLLGKTCNLGIVDELAAPDMLLQYSLDGLRNGQADIKVFMTDFPQSVSGPQFLGCRRSHC